MKNICIVSFCNLYLLPYSKHYINTFINNKAKCTLAFWDRDSSNTEENNYANCEIDKIEFRLSAKSSILRKIFGYIKSTIYFWKILWTKQFDGIVFLQSHAAMACFPILRVKYKNKYIIDIRDYTFENNKLYFKLEEKAINYSYNTVISSPAYKSFLPKDIQYVLAHNINDSGYCRSNDLMQLPIKISFIGSVRFLEINKKLLELFSNDNRFQLNYYGRGSESLMSYCKSKDIKNVDFHGAFDPQDTELFYKKTDLVNNLYGNGTPFLDYALSNKLYYSCQTRKPILVCPNTYMAEIVSRYDLGFVFDYDNPHEPDRLYSWFNNLEWDTYNDNCDLFLKKVEKDNTQFLEMIARFVKEV